MAELVTRRQRAGSLWPDLEVVGKVLPNRAGTPPALTGRTRGAGLCAWLVGGWVRWFWWRQLRSRGPAAVAPCNRRAAGPARSAAQAAVPAELAAAARAARTAARAVRPTAARAV